MYGRWGPSVIFVGSPMRISSSRKVLMNSSAFHELTGKAIRGILPLDLSLSWQEKRRTKPMLLPLHYNSKRDVCFSVWIAVNREKWRGTHSISKKGLWGRLDNQ